jgi:hypothetical protein
MSTKTEKQRLQVFFDLTAVTYRSLFEIKQPPGVVGVVWGAFGHLSDLAKKMNQKQVFSKLLSLCNCEN